jgi:2-iminobutanoate/2-iminopropanoate deaminase
MSETERTWIPVTLPDFPPPAGAYSPGVRAGNLLFVSGQTPRDVATGQIQGTTFEEQTRLTLRNLERIIVASGASLSAVVSVTVYLSDEDNWGAFDQIYRSVFSPPYPTRAVVGAELRGIMVEVSAIAYIE